MRIVTAEQGTKEWHRAKRGVLSASRAEVPLMGKHTKTRRLYVQELADDLEGVPNFDEERTASWFLDGKYYESWARGWYSWTYSKDVATTGFVIHDEYSWIGCSPDGIVNGRELLLEPGVTYIPAADEGLVEIKYRKTLRSFDRNARAGVVGAILPQVQTQLFVTGCAWCDYVNYWRWDDGEREKGHVQRVYRNDAYIENMLLPAFVIFWQEVQEELARRSTMSKTNP